MCDTYNCNYLKQSTKIMIVGSDGNEDPIVVDGTEVEHVTQFNFLRSLITTSSGCSTELRSSKTYGNGQVSYGRSEQNLD